MEYIVIGGAAAIWVAVSLLLAFIFRRVVPTNMVHIVQSSKKTTSYGKGQAAGNTYYAWPAFLPIIGVSVLRFPESVFEIRLDGYEAYDSRRLPFEVDVVGFFRVENSGVAAHRVESFEALQEQLKAVLQGAVRRVLARNPLEETMEARGALGVQFTEEVNEQLTQEWGVKAVRTIEFMDLRDSAGSQVIANIMAKDQSRIDRESREAVAENRRAAEMAEVDARREVDLRKQDAAQAVGMRTAEKTKAVGIAEEQAQQEIKSQAKVTAERSMEVTRVNDVKKAEIAAEVAVRKADGEAQALVKSSEGELTQARNDAAGALAAGESKAQAEKLLLLAPVAAQIDLAREIGENKGYQEYLIKLRQVEAGMEVGKEIANAIGNADLKIISTGGDGGVQGGVAKLADMFTAKGGTSITGMLAALAQTDEGKALLSKVTGDPDL